MFENVISFFKRVGKKDKLEEKSKDTAKERLHLVLMQDRANVSADFLDMMRQEIIEVIKKYIDVDESDIDVRLTNKMNEDGSTGAPALYANIPIAGIKENIQNKGTKKTEESNKEEINKTEEIKEEQTKEEVNVENNAEKEIKADASEEKKENEEVEEIAVEEKAEIIEEKEDANIKTEENKNSSKE